MNSSSSGETLASAFPSTSSSPFCSRVSAERLISRMRLLGIERDHARGDARQHRLDEGAAGFELGIGGRKRAGLLLEPARSCG